MKTFDCTHPGHAGDREAEGVQMTIETTEDLAAAIRRDCEERARQNQGWERAGERLRRQAFARPEDRELRALCGESGDLEAL